MDYNKLFSIMDCNTKTRKISCEDIYKLNEHNNKYVYYSSKENYNKVISNSILHEYFAISENPGKASCKLISLENINNTYFPNKDFVFNETIGYSEWNNSNYSLRKPLKKVNVYVKSNEDFNINETLKEEGYMYCISKEEFNSNKKEIPYVKKYKIYIDYTITGVK